MKHPRKAVLLAAQRRAVDFLVLTCKATEIRTTRVIEGYTPAPQFEILDTKVGTLHVTLFFTPKISPWIACRFKDVDRAARHFDVPASHVGFHQFNPHSGKWNFVTPLEPMALVDYFMEKVGQLLITSTPLEDAVEVLQKLEWFVFTEHGHKICLMCGSNSEQGHTPRCKMASALARAKEGQ